MCWARKQLLGIQDFSRSAVKPTSLGVTVFIWNPAVELFEGRVSCIRISCILSLLLWSFFTTPVKKRSSPNLWSMFHLFSLSNVPTLSAMSNHQRPYSLRSALHPAFQLCKALEFCYYFIILFFLNWNAFPSAECYGWILAALAKWFWNHVDIYKIFVKFLNWKQQRWALSRCWLKGMMKTVILQQKDFWQVQTPPRKIFPRLHLVFSTFMDTGAECDR